MSSEFSPRLHIYEFFVIILFERKCVLIASRAVSRVKHDSDHICDEFLARVLHDLFELKFTLNRAKNKIWNAIKAVVCRLHTSQNYFLLFSEPQCE